MTSRAGACHALSRSRLGHAFYARDALIVARELIGALLVHVADGVEPRVARIVETEAYRGPTDAACHARFGLTKRTRVLFGPPGRAYVFLIYGMYDCLNAVCMAEGAGHAVLIRGVAPVSGVAPNLRGDGPGRLTRTLGITRAHDGVDLVTSDELFIARGSEGATSAVVASSARVGVGYAGDDALAPWRFFDADSAHVSRPSARLIGLGPVAPAANRTPRKATPRPAAKAPKGPVPEPPDASSTASARRRPSGTTPGTPRRGR